jgi:hypothetical protein
MGALSSNFASPGSKLVLTQAILLLGAGKLHLKAPILYLWAANCCLEGQFMALGYLPSLLWRKGLAPEVVLFSTRY